MARHERWVVAGVVTVLSAFAHLWKLGLRPLNHDEAIDAWFSWQARHGAVMEYDPVYHGPLRFYLEGFLLNIFGTGPTAARLLAALAGIVATFVIASSVRTLGRIGAPIAALLFTLSPTILTVTRTGREDSLVGLFSVALLLLVARALTEPRPAHLVAAGALLAASFGLKETTFLFGLNAFVFFVVAGVVASARPEGRCRAAVRRLVGLGVQPWVWTAMVFALVFMVIFTSGFRYAAGLESGLLDGVRYWWSQQEVGRGGQPWYYYLNVYAAYEWLLVVLAIAGLVHTVLRRSLVGAWFASMAIGQVILYAWAGEKFAWLAMHPLLPTVLLAGLGVQAIAERLREPDRRAWRPVLAGAGLVALAFTTIAAVRPGITHGADPRELLVAVQTSVDVPPVVDRLAQGQADGTIRNVAVDQEGGGAWPWSWYLIELDNVAYGPLDQSDLPTDFDAIIVWAEEFPPEVPPGYRMERFRLREWWVPDYKNAGVADVTKWFFTRDPWSSPASSDQYLLLREPETAPPPDPDD